MTESRLCKVEASPATDCQQGHLLGQASPRQGRQTPPGQYLLPIGLQVALTAQAEEYLKVIVLASQGDISQLYLEAVKAGISGQSLSLDLSQLHRPAPVHPGYYWHTGKHTKPV